MQNSEQIREFFRKMADGHGLNADGHSLLHGADAVAGNRFNHDEPRIERSTSFNDFGVGLPPMAHA